MICDKTYYIGNTCLIHAFCFIYWLFQASNCNMNCPWTHTKSNSIDVFIGSGSNYIENVCFAYPIPIFSYQYEFPILNIQKLKCYNNL